MGDMEKEEAVKKPPTIAISPSFLYGVRAGVQVIKFSEHWDHALSSLQPSFAFFRVESTSARSRRCFTRPAVGSPVLKLTTLAMEANKTWLVSFKFNFNREKYPFYMFHTCGQVPMVNKGAHITAIALNPTRQLLAFTERGERPLLVIISMIRA